MMVTAHPTINIITISSTLPACDGANDVEGFGARGDCVRQRFVVRIERDVLLAREKSHHRAALVRVCDRGSRFCGAWDISLPRPPSESCGR